MRRMTAVNCGRRRQDLGPLRNTVIEIDWLKKKVNNMLIEPDWLNMLMGRDGNKVNDIQADQVRFCSLTPGHLILLFY
jgi:hypothetical protein